MSSSLDTPNNKFKLQSISIESQFPKNIEKLKKKIDIDFLSKPIEKISKPEYSRIEKLIDKGHGGLAYKLIKDYILIKEDLLMMEKIIQLDLDLDDVKLSYWCELILNIDSKNKPALSKFLEVKINDKDWGSADNIANDILKYWPKNIYALEYRISQNIKNKNWNNANKDVENILRQDENNIMALKSGAKACNAINRMNKCVSYLQRYIEKVDLDQNERHRIARIFYNAKEYEKVINLLNKDCIEIRNIELLCRSYHSLQEWDNCFRVASELVKIAPDNLLGLRLKMRSLRRVRDRKGASIYAERIFEYDKKDYEAVRTLIQNSAANDEWAAVEEFSKIGLEIPKLKKESQRWYARSLTRQLKDGAFEAWGQLITEDYKEIEGRIEIGKIHYNNFNNDKAKIIFEEGLEIEPKNSRLNRLLASSKLRLGEFRDALPLLEAQCIDNPHSVSAWESMIETNMKIENKAEVNRIWKILLNNSWESMEYLMLCLEISLRFHWKERYDWIINTRMEKFEDDDYLYLNLSRIHLNIGDIASSWKYLLLSKENDDKIKLFSEIKKILELTRTNEDEINAAIKDNKAIWITALAIRQIIRDREHIETPRKVKNIMLISSSLNRGGAERQVAYTLRGLNKSKFNVKLAVKRIDTRGNNQTYLDLLENEALDIIEADEVKIQKPEKTSKLSELLELLPSTTREMVRKLIIIFRNEKPDLVHAWQDEIILSSSIAAIINGSIKILGSARSMRPDEKGELHIRKRPHIGQCIEMLLKEDIFMMSANSYAGRDSYSQWLGISPNEIEVIHNGVDFEFLEGNANIHKFNEMMKQFGIKEGHIVIGGVFRLEPGKRVDLWLDSIKIAIEKNNNLRGIIVGGGRIENTVREWIIERNLQRRVHMTGAVNDVFSWLDRMDLFLFTSSSEGLPNVVIEAQGFGVPVVSTDVGGVKEIIIDGVTGKIMKSSDKNDIAAGIIEIIPKIEEMSKEAKKVARSKFSIDNMIETTQTVYLKIFN